MTTKVACPACGQHIEAEGELIGESIVCPNCNHPFVPTAADAFSKFDRDALQKLRDGMKSGELKFRVKIEVVDDDGNVRPQ